MTDWQSTVKAIHPVLAEVLEQIKDDVEAIQGHLRAQNDDEEVAQPARDERTKRMDRVIATELTRLKSELALAVRERDQMRPVFKAAVAWRHWRNFEYRPGKTNPDLVNAHQEDLDLAKAVDALSDTMKAGLVSGEPRPADPEVNPGVEPTVAGGWYPIPCEHGWDHCPKCDRCKCPEPVNVSGAAHGGAVIHAEGRTNPDCPVHGFEFRAATITNDLMVHFGYEPEAIAAAEAAGPHSPLCDFQGDAGWLCLDEDGNSHHPVLDELAKTAALVMFVLEHRLISRRPREESA